ncbi:XkdF-like putative serine protease domain-containing protein [Halosimplex halophilum]|uniref:XkdF-like putative serine protease domain-containing protein n=1 Tax=Halosimplex halophilum TaxID=2559572 RepID=UPI001AE9E108|nr:XkdF-like putative serine protease domain-containing protein [Halosimplex halophilum]
MKTKKSDGPSAIRKDVEWVAKDDDEQVATGIVMVPDKADLQNDFVREDQIRAFAEQFENFESVGEAGGGIMHAVFPDDWLDLERNEVLDEPETIGGETAPAGAWVQSWKYNNDDLWQLVADGILAGYSVGIDSVRWDGPYEQDDDAVDDVEVPPEIGDEELIWRIVEGIMREVSTVDIPAVPDAEILSKDDAEKRLGDYLGNRDGFIEEAMERGHSEAEAERMWDVLNEAADLEGAGQPGEKSDNPITRAGRAFLSALSGGDAGEGGANVAETPDADPRGASKEGRTLSQANRESAMAAVDANLDILHDAGVGEDMMRFTDRDDVDFDLSEHDAREAVGDHDEDDEGDGEADANYAAGGDTPDDDTTMSDNPNDGEGEKSLAEQNAEQIDDLSDKVDEIHRAITGEEKTREIEIGGETVEVSESELKAALGVEEEAAGGDIEELQSEIKSLEQRVNTIAEQGGASGQVRSAATGDGGEGDDKLSQVGELLS